MCFHLDGVGCFITLWPVLGYYQIHILISALLTSHLLQSMGLLKPFNEVSLIKSITIASVISSIYHTATGKKGLPIA